MSIYKCFLFFLMACMAVNVQAASSKRIVINAGNDYTFRCRFPNNLDSVYWYRRSYVDHQYSKYISLLQPTRGVPIHYYPDFVGQRIVCQHNVSTSPGYGIFSLTVFNMTIADSAMYSCSSADFLRRYDTKVVGCPCIVTMEPLLDHGTAPPLSSNRKNVTCTLVTYPRPNFVSAQTIIRRDNNYIIGSILGNKIRFSLNDTLRKNLMITTNLFSDFEGNISCVVPAQLTPTLTLTRMIATVMSTSIATPIEKLSSPPSIDSTTKTPSVPSSTITPTEKLISPSSVEPPTSTQLISTRIFTPNEKNTSPSSFESTTTTQLMSTSITTPNENPNTEPSTNHLFTRDDNTTSSQAHAIISTSIQVDNSLQNTPKETDKQKGDSGRTIVIVISAVGSSVIVLMLVIAMVVLRFRRKRERTTSGSTPGRHETGEEQVEVEETDMCYASIQDTAPPEHARTIPGTEKEGDGKLDCSSFSSDGMVDNHLYDFNMDGSRRERTTELSTVDAGGPLYTMPNKANKSGSGSYRDLCEAQKEIVHPSRHPSLSSRGRSDDVTPPQESQEGAKHHGGGRDGTGDVMLDLYAVPNKCPGPRKVAAHYNPGKPDDNHDKGHDVSALYAVVDRSTEVAKEEPRDVTDLYAVVDKRSNNE